MWSDCFQFFKQYFMYPWSFFLIKLQHIVIFVFIWLFYSFISASAAKIQYWSGSASGFLCICSQFIQLCYHQPFVSALPRSKGKNMLISDRYCTKKRGKQNSESIWAAQKATVKVTYCSVPVGYTVVIDWLTRAEWFLSPWGMRRSLCSLLCRKIKKTKKKQVQQKRRTAKGQFEMFLTSTLYGSTGNCSLYDCF